MKKITFVVANMVGGGTERVIANLSNEMVKRGYQVTILMTAGNTVDYPLHENVTVISLGNPTEGSIGKKIDRIQKLRAYYKNNQDNVVLSFGIETNLYAIMAGLGLPIQVVVSERNDPNQCSYKFVRDLIYSQADKFVFQTPDAMKCFSKKLQNRGRVIVNPIKEDLPEPYVGKEHEKRIVAVGRLTAQKNHKLLIDAFSKFIKTYSEYQLVIYGQGELEEELQKQIKELGLEENITLAGFSPNVLEEIKMSKMYVLTSDYEGMSNSLMEAMAMGVPVISTDCPIGGSAMLIQNLENGILIPVADVDAVVEAMTKVAENNSLCERLAINGLAVRTKYAINRICDEWIRFIEE